jgi:hypothetical protein
VRVKNEVVALTALLRESGDDFWGTLRLVLDSRGVDARGAWLAFSVELGDDAEFAVIVTGPGEIVELSWQPSTGAIFEWTAITDWWRASPYSDGVEEALQLRAAT